MGMFDYIRCNYPLPDFPKELNIEKLLFQTKDFESQMHIYTITNDGLIIREEGYGEAVPEEERPYYGKPEWKIPLYQLFGSMRWIRTGESVLSITDAVRFYTSYGEPPYKWLEYQAIFEDGQLSKIIKVKP